MRTNEGFATELASYGYGPAAIINYVTPRNEGCLKDADSRGYASSPADDEHLELSLQVSPDLSNASRSPLPRAAIASSTSCESISS